MKTRFACRPLLRALMQRTTIVLATFTLATISLGPSPLHAQPRTQRALDGPEPLSPLSEAARAHLFDPNQPRTRGDLLPCEQFALRQVIVRFDTEIDQETIDRHLDELQLESVRQLSPLGLYLLENATLGDPQEDRQATLDLLSEVRMIDLRLQATLNCPGEGSDVDFQTGERGVSDTHAGEQWHLHGDAGVNALQAWEITTGSEEIVVAIIDSGYVPEHPELVDRIYRSPDEIDDDVDNESDGWVDDVSGWDFVAYDEEADDEHRHGSWVAGLFGAAADNGFGVSGLDHLARIMPIKVLDSTNSGFTSDLIAALDYALLHPEVRIVNLSLINYPDDPMLHDAIQALATQAILVACAGNAGPGTADGQFPGAYPETISIAWTGSGDQIAPNSSSGSTVDFSAPGLDVVTINPLNFEDQFHVVYGCSFATPLMSAAASLTLAIRPQTDSSDLRFLLQRSVEDLGPEGWDEDFGWGRLDAHSLLIEAQDLIFQGSFDSGGTGRWK